MNNKNYYETLGVAKDATIKEIKKAYRKKAIELHPDHNKNVKQATKNMVALIQAYKILVDPISRQQYDVGIAYEQAAQARAKTTTQDQSSTHDSYQSAYRAEPARSAPKQPRTLRQFVRTYRYAFFVGIIFLILYAHSHLPALSSFVQTNYAHVPIPTDTPSITPTPTGDTYSGTYTSVPPATTTTEVTVDCIGPDGKHLQITQQECDAFNTAWKNVSPTPTPTPHYSGFTITPYDWYSNAPTSTPIPTSTPVPTPSCNACGSNSSCSYGSCTCNNGYLRNYTTGACDEVVCPTNSTKSNSTCTCNTGYLKNYTTGACDLVVCPPNSTQSNSTCTCNTGYVKNYSSGGCDLVVCPANATESNSTCTCNTGFTMNYSTNHCDPAQ